MEKKEASERMQMIDFLEKEVEKMKSDLKEYIYNLYKKDIFICDILSRIKTGSFNIPLIVIRTLCDSYEIGHDFQDIHEQGHSVDGIDNIMSYFEDVLEITEDEATEFQKHLNQHCNTIVNLNVDYLKLYGSYELFVISGYRDFIEIDC